MSSEQSSSLLLISNTVLASRLSKKASNRLAFHGISLNEYIVMHFLSSEKVSEVSRVELAEYLGMSASGVTRMLLPMEKNGIIERIKNPRDSRQSLVKLSKAGRQLFSDASVSFSHIAEDLFARLSPAQQDKLIDLQQKIM